MKTTENTPAFHKLVRAAACMLLAGGLIAACANMPNGRQEQTSPPDRNLAPQQQTAGNDVPGKAPSTSVHASEPVINPANWPRIETPPLDPAIEKRVDAILAKMTLQQKVGQVIQADSGSVTPEDVRTYRLGSVLSGGNSAPGPLPYADTRTWLAAADAYFAASVDPEGVDIAIPVIWGIDAVHGHANLAGAIIFPHNIGLGAANNPDLIADIARITAHDLNISGHDWTFAPTLAVPRNDRWGRTYEGFSENPAIVASYAPHIVHGLQGKPGAPDFMGTGQVIASAKHFVGDGGTRDGIDQGDARISEAQLRDIHAAGYETALKAGVQTVMASFSAWQGQSMHGHKPLLTDVLKGQMQFRGFVVGDWNGHALIPGCTAEDCPQALNAGIDMYMAPDSWKGLWHSTHEHVRSGVIPMERLDDAVRRILRVKVMAGLFEKPVPSRRVHAGEEDRLGMPAHRRIARQAVRESLVLLKNNNRLLPLDATGTFLVTGDGADSIAKAAGGWTLSWQGGGYDNAQFPNGESILSGIRAAVGKNGGMVIFDPQSAITPDDAIAAGVDTVIAVYGEDPYAEFQGDISHLDFISNGFDTQHLKTYRAAGLPVVSVFLSGRPLWTNPEINASDAFVAAWLPGSEGGGIADLLFRVQPEHDFTGRLSYSWPKRATQVELNVNDKAYDPLFPFGYGLSYGDDKPLLRLSEDSGLDDTKMTEKGVFFHLGQTPEPWSLIVNDEMVDSLPRTVAGLTLVRLDKEAQEDALGLAFTTDTGYFAIVSTGQQDISRESNGAMELTFNARLREGPGTVMVGTGCAGDTDCTAMLPVTLGSEWQKVRLTLSCFAGRGVDMRTINRAFIISGQPGQRVDLADIRLDSDTDAQENCGDS